MESFSSLSSSSAILPDGKLNVDLLSREIEKDLANDCKYKAEDGMKKRAIHSSKDYAEFRAFVACSQLEPLQSSQLKELIQPSASGRSSAYCSKIHKLSQHQQCNEVHDVNKILSSSKSQRDRRMRTTRAKKSTQKDRNDLQSLVPKNALDLERLWKKYCPSDNEGLRMNYVKTILTPQFLFQCFDSSSKSKKKKPSMLSSSSLDPLIMGEILETLQNIVQANACQREEKGVDCITNEMKGQPDHNPNHGIIENYDHKEVTPLQILQWMYAFSLCDRFSLNISFLEKNHVAAVNFLLDWLEESFSSAKKVNDNDGSDERLQQRKARLILEDITLSKERILKLKELYQVV